MAYPILFVLLLSTSLPLSAYCGGGFSTRLIHRDSPASPFYNPSLSSSDRLRAAARRSVDRANFLRSVAAARVSDASSRGGSGNFGSEVIPNNVEYLMTINVGTPPFKILAIADTGSDLTWTQCKPCVECYKQDAPIFDPSRSSTYGTVSCQANSCSALPQGGCGKGSTCEYRYSYGDQSYTVGALSSETVTFDSDGKRPVSIPKILFGCSHESNGTFDEHGSGLVGLGGGSLSLVSQLGSTIDRKFSYCLVPYSDTKNSTSLLNFGDRAVVSGPNTVTTPIVAGETDTFYYLTLESISVGDEKVASLAAAGGSGNVIIDSGTTLTILDDGLVDPLVRKLSGAVKYPKVTDPDGLFDLCFDVSGVSNVDLPDLTFGFSGAPLRLPAMNTFVLAKEGTLCLAIVSGSKLGGAGGVSIFGNIAQQNLHVGYDLGARKLSIAPADCANL